MHFTTEFQLAGHTKWAGLIDRVQSCGFDYSSIGISIGHYPKTNDAANFGDWRDDEPGSLNAEAGGPPTTHMTKRSEDWKIE